MQYLKIAVLLFLLLISLSACSKSPETARKELGQMNIDYTGDSFFSYVERGDKVVVELFLTAGKSPNLRAKTAAEEPILSIAASKGHDEIIKLLIAKGADVNAKDKNGRTSLMNVTMENLETMKILLSKGADVNTEITYEDLRLTPLTMVVYAGVKEEYRNTEIVKAMVNKGSANDKNLREALLIAKEIGYTEAVDILKKAGAKE